MATTGREGSSDWSLRETRRGESPTRLLDQSAPTRPEVSPLQNSSVKHANSSETTSYASPEKNALKHVPEDRGIPGDVEKTIAEDFCIARKSDEKWFCALCEREFSDKRELAEHAIGNEHSESTKKYGCENIAILQWRLYRCVCCDCKISGKKNVCVHLRGKRHAACNFAKLRADELEREEKSKADAAKASTDIAKLVRSYRAKTAERAARRRRAAAQANCEKVDCDFCNYAVDNSARLHSHLARHLSAAFVGAKLDENENVLSTSEPAEAENISCGRFSESSRRAQRSARRSPPDPPIEKALMRKVARRLRSDQRHIYELREKKDAATLSSRLCLVRKDGSVFCLVCRSTHENFDCVEHTWSLDHIAELANMQRDDELFESAPGQLSELRLALDFMLETPEGSVRCLLCDKVFEDSDETLRSHIFDDAHATQRRAQRGETEPIFRDALRRASCDWYGVHNYWCVACSANFDAELDFAEHLNSVEHSTRLRRMKVSLRCLIFDFCPSCALLWYGHPTTCVYHRQLSSHKWLLKDGHYATHDLPQAAQCLLRDAERYVDGEFVNVDRRDETIVKLINESFPVCRKIINFVKQWLLLCNLTGSGGISDCAIFWYVVFYLQQESVLPRIAALSATSNKSGLFDDFTALPSSTSSRSNDATSKLTFKKYLSRFFRYYGNFDYRQDVACPLLGQIVEKRLFVEPNKLPREMSAYVDRTKKFLNPEPLRVDFPMCVQDPFDLAENLTKNVSKFCLGRFRNYCAKSRDWLCSF